MKFILKFLSKRTFSLNTQLQWPCQISKIGGKLLTGAVITNRGTLVKFGLKYSLELQ